MEIVRALPHLTAGTIRTHIVSRCCVNAPKNHPHKWDYFERVSRGEYEIRVPYRVRTPRTAGVAEQIAAYGGAESTGQRDTIHVVVSESAGWFVAECLEVAVVTQARSLDELVSNLREAVALHLSGERPAALGLAASPRLTITYEVDGPGR